jgi:hypothetical protein
VISHELAFLTPILIVPGSLLALRRPALAIGLPVAAMAWAFPAYAVVVTGDFMAMGRFLIPGLAFGAILLAWILDAVWSPRRARRAAVLVGTAALLTLGLLPGWDIHVVPETVRERFRFRFNSPEFHSEYFRWQQQAANAEVWGRRGKALRSYIEQRGLRDQNPSYVIGGIGATAYYADMYIYDCHGLVFPEVARRAIEPSDEPRSPGHDKHVKKEYFLKYKPTILQAKVVQVPRAETVADVCQDQVKRLQVARRGGRLERRYVVDVARVHADLIPGPPCYVITWTRIADGESREEAWGRCSTRINRLQSGRHMPPP